MAVTYRSSASATANSQVSSYSLVPSKPSGVVDNDLLFAHVVLTGTGTSSTPSGWTLLDSDTGSGDPTSYLFYKVASSEGSTYTFNITQLGTSSGRVTISAFYNTRTTSPIDAHSVKRNSSSTTATGTAITPTIAPESLLLFFVGDSGSSVFTHSGYAVATTNPTWTEAYDDGNGSGGNDVSQALAYADRGAVTSTGTPTATLSGSAINTVYMVAIGPTGFTLAAPLLSQATTTLEPTESSVQNPTADVLVATVSTPESTATTADPKWSNVQKSASGTITNTQKT